MRNFKVQTSVDNEEKLKELVDIDHQKVFDERQLNLFEIQKTVKEMMTLAQNSVET